MQRSVFVGLLPVVSLGVNQVGRLNLGRCVSSLQYFTVYGQQEGYRPLAANMARDPALWMSWHQPQFSSIKPDDQHVQVRLSVYSRLLTGCYGNRVLGLWHGKVIYSGQAHVFSALIIALPFYLFSIYFSMFFTFQTAV